MPHLVGLAYRFVSACLLACLPTIGAAASEGQPPVSEHLERIAPESASWANAYPGNVFPTTQWKAGQATDCERGVCPDKLFVIICDAKTMRYIRSLRELARLQAEYRHDPQFWSDTMSDAYPCITNNSFRLGNRSGIRAREKDDEDAIDLSFQVMLQGADRQLVEVRYGKGTDVIDSFFKYEVDNGRVIPLESWVFTRGHMGIAIMYALIALIVVFALLLSWALFRGIRWLLRRFKARRLSESRGSDTPEPRDDGFQ